LVPVAMTGWPGWCCWQEDAVCGAVRLARLGLGLVAD
jgi:hypothetical protein